MKHLANVIARRVIITISCRELGFVYILLFVEVIRGDFIDTVTKHPNLVNLNVAANRLGMNSYLRFAKNVYRPSAHVNWQIVAAMER